MVIRTSRARRFASLSAAVASVLGLIGGQLRAATETGTGAILVGAPAELTTSPTVLLAPSTASPSTWLSEAELALFNAGGMFGPTTPSTAGELEAYASNLSFASSGTALSSPITSNVTLNGTTLDLTPIANTATQGLSGRVFSTDGRGDTSRIDFTSTAASLRTDTNFNQSATILGATPLTNTAVQWLGKLSITAAGTYNFSVGSDDGSRLWIDGVLIVQNDGAKGVFAGTASLALSSGLHDIRVDYAQGGGGAGLVLQYSGPDQAVLGVIPSTKLFTAESSTLTGASNAVVIGAGNGDSLDVSGASQVNLHGSAFTQAQMGTATFAAGSSLQLNTDSGVTGKALRFFGPATFGAGAGVTLNLAGDGTNGANLYFDGAVSDGGVATTIIKQGSGRLFFDQTTSANSLLAATVLDVQAGVLNLVGSSAAGSFNPIGSATVQLSGGGVVLDSKIGSLTAPTTFNNAINVTADGTIQDIASGGSLVNLGGTVSIASGTTLTLDPIAGGNPVGSLGALLNLNGTLTGSGTLNIISSNIGTLTITPVKGMVEITGNASGFTGTTMVSPGGALLMPGPGVFGGRTITLAGGSVNFFNDGNGTGAQETITYIDDVTLTADSTINVNRLGTTFAPLFTTASNKNIQIGGLSTGGFAVTATGANGYGLTVTGTTTISGTQVFNVTNATASNINPGLTLAGPVTGGASITKIGAGTLVLSNNANDIGNSTVLLGVLGATSDAALGNAANTVTIGFNATGTADTNTTTTITVADTTGLLVGTAVSGAGIPAGATITAITGPTTYTISAAATATAAGVPVTYGGTAAFEAFGTFSTGRAFTFASTTAAGANNINVTRGNTLTITSPLTGSIGFTKGDPGTLVLTSSGSTITAPILASGGALRITNANALGSTSALTVAANEGSAFQLDGSGGAITFARPITLNGSTGILNNGQLENFAGSNTVSGLITLAGGATIGNSAAGTTLTLSGGIAGAQALVFNGAGNINVTTVALPLLTSLTKNGLGVTTISTPASTFAGAISVNGGGLTLSGSTAFAAAAVATTIQGSSTLWVDNTGTTVSNRFGGATTPRTMTLAAGGTFRYSVGATNVTESTGALTSAHGGNTVRIDPGTGTSALTFASLANNGGSTLLFQSGATGSGAVFGSTNNQVFFTTAPGATPATSGILQRVIVLDNTGGTPTYNFASYNHTGLAANTLGLQAFQGYNASNNLVTAAATDTMRLTASANLAGSRTLNAIASSGAGITLNAPGPQTLTLTAANLLVQSGDLTIGSNVILAGVGVEWGLNVAPGATLNVNGVITNANNVTAGLGGTININSRQFFNTAGNYFTVNGGTVKLNAGDQTLYSGQTTGANQNLAVGPGATLDLNGTVQLVGNLRSPNAVNITGTGGTITSVAPATLAIRQVNGTGEAFGGQITGGITLVQGSTAIANVFRLFNDNTYTGRTLITGGVLELTDQARLSATSAIDINYGTLNILNTSANNGRFNLPDRVNDAAAITLRGGFILLAGRAQSATSESIGAVTLAQGVSNLNVTTGGTGINSSILTLADLQRSNPDAALNLNGAGGQLGSAARLLITSREANAGLTNNILGGWAVNGGADFLSYVPTLGLAALNANGFAGYTGTVLPGASDATSNIKLAAAAVVPTGGLTLNSLVANSNVTFGTTTSTDVLNLASGGFLKSAGAVVLIGSVANEGRLTAGGPGASGTQFLYLHNNAAAANTITVNSAIVNDGAAPVRVVAVGYNGGVTLLNGTNTYTGGTVIDGWNGTGGNVQGITLGATGTLGTGGLIINNGLFTQTAGGVLPTQTVTLNASSTLTLAGNNTLTNLVFDNDGGTAAPAVNTGGVLTLTAATPISITSNNSSTLPVINGTLDFGGAAKTLSVGAIAFNGKTISPLQPTLNIAGLIQNTGQITIDGGGNLQLSGQNTFASGVLVKAGSGLVLGASSTPTVNGTIVSGPVGTGALTLESGATVLATAATTLLNPLVIQGNVNFGGIQNITFNGPLSLPGTAVTLNIAAPQQTISLFGPVTSGSTSGITKTGYGTLALGTAVGGTITLPGGGSLSFLDDGDGTGSPQLLPDGASISSTGATVLTVGRNGTTYAPYFPSAANKTIRLGSLDLVGNTLTVNNNNGYGLQFLGTTTLANNDQIITVATATASNVTQGLILSGKVTGGFGIVKQGAGTLVLNNATNDFGGAGKLIDIQAGVVAVDSDGALGNAANVVRLNTNTATASGLRATGTFSTGRVITLNTAANAIEVTRGNTLTLTSAFGLTAVANTLTKNDAGTLALTVANPTWTGGLTVAQGIALLSNSTAAGTGPITVSSATGAALQLTGGVTIANNITTGVTGGAINGGINSAGGIESVSGVNTITGTITQTAGSALLLGADTNSTLNINGVLTTSNSFYMTGGGDIVFNTIPVTGAAQFTREGGTGTTTLNVASAGTGTVNSWAGTIVLKNGGQLGVLAATAAGVSAYGGAGIRLDDSGTQLATRLNNRGVTLNSGVFSYIGNAANSTETSTQGLTLQQGSVYNSTQTGAGTVTVTFATLAFAADSAAVFSGANLGTASNRLLFTTAPTLVGGVTAATNGLLARGIVTSGGGFDFATYNTNGTAVNTNGIQAFTAYTTPADINAAVATDTPLVTANQAITAGTNKTLNAIKISGTGITIGGAASANPQVPTTLTITSGGIAVTGGTDTISTPVLAFAGNQAIIHVDTGSTLNLNSTVTGTAGFVKADGGTLLWTGPANAIGLANLSANVALTGTYSIDGGTLQIGSNNTLAPNSFLRVAVGATFNLGANSQYVQSLFHDASSAGAGFSVEGAGGTVTGLAGSTLVANYDNTARQLAGQITGGVFFNRAGQQTQQFYGNNTYTGGTLLNGGTTSLTDGGRFSGTSAIDLNYASLTLNNNLNNPVGTASLPDRINDAAAINLRGGTFTLQGRLLTDTTETIGAVSVLEGFSTISNQNGAGTGISSSVLTIASVAHPTGSTGTLRFTGGFGQIGSVSREILTTSTLTSNILGPWSVFDREWTSVIPTLGVGALNSGGFAGYATNVLGTTSLASDNIRLTAATTLTGTGAVNAYTLNFQWGAGLAVDLGGRNLVLAGGGLLLTTATDNTTGTISNGSITSGFANGTVNDLYTYTLPYGGTNRQAVISAVITDNGATSVRLVASSSEAAGSAERTTLTAVNTYTGGTVINGGTLVVGVGGVLPGGGITINGGLLDQGAATQATPGTIAASNVVTLNGVSTASLVGNNTLAGLVFNNNGGGATAPTVNTSKNGQGTVGFTAIPNTGGGGVLTIGAGGITASSSNVTSTSLIVGRIDTGSAPTTITVNPIIVNGFQPDPLQPSLAIQGWVNSSGTITKAGTGVLQLNAQETFTGQLNVIAGGVGFGTLGNTGVAGNNNPGSRFANFNIAAGAFLNLSSTDVTIGSLSGAGNVINVAPTGVTALRTLNLGFDNSSTTFSGSFARFTDGFPAAIVVNKLGTGTLSLTGASNETSTLQVSQGGVAFSGAGAGVFGTYIVAPTATLTLDNSGTNLSNRLGGTGALGTLQLSGGTVRLVGNAAAPTNETVATINFGATNSNGPSVLQIESASQATTLTATTLSAVAQGTGVIRGINSGVGTLGTANVVVSTTFNGLGGTGANGTTTMAVRPDLLGDSSVTGAGTGFIVRDSVTGALRTMAANEMQTTLVTGSANTNVNVSLSGAQTALATNTAVGTLTLNSGAGLALLPALLPAGATDGLAITQTINTGGILALAGNTGINVGRITTTGNAQLILETVGNLTLGGTVASTTGGLSKTGAGNLTLASKELYTGNSNFTGGTTTLAGGDNTLPVFATGGAPTTVNLSVNNGATLDLNGTNQLVTTLFTSTTGRYAGEAGTLTNSGANSTFTSLGGSAQTFGGTIAGNLNFTKTGNTTLTLTNANTYTGVTNVRANTLTLLDQGTLANTSAINLNYGGLNIDQSGLNPLTDLNPQRLNVNTSLTLRGGTLTLTSGGSADSTQNVATGAGASVTAAQGHSTISVPQAPVTGMGGLVIGNLVLNPDATLNVTGGNSSAFFSALPGYNNSQLFLNQINGVAIPATITNKILPANIITNNGEFTTYLSAGTTGTNGITYGVMTMNGSTGALGTITQDLYDSNTTTLPVSGATSNVRLTATAAVALPGVVGTPATTFYNVLAVRAATPTITFVNATDVLNLSAGGLALTNGGTTLGGAVGSGFLTAGGTPTAAGTTVPLYIHNAGAANTINSIIADNLTAPGNKVRLVVGSYANTLNLAAQNTYTGGTVINGGGGSVTLSGAAGVVEIPAGGVTLNNATLVASAQANQIATGNDLTLNGGSVLTLGAFANTLNSVTFNNNGGTANPTVTIGTVSLTLASATPITAVNDNAITTPTVAGTALILSNAAPTITTSTTANVPTDLIISAPITSAGGAITKTGTGSLVLSGANTFTTGINLNNGTLILGNNAALGTGTLTVNATAPGTTAALISDSAVRTVTNAVVLNSDVTFGSTSGVANASTVAVNGVILNGTLSLGAASRTINVNSFLNTSTIGGIVSNTAAGVGINKTGSGILALGGANTFDGPVTLSGGILSATVAGGLGAGAGTGNIVFAGGVLQHGGTNTTDYSSRFSTAINQPFFIDTVANTVTYATPLTSAGGLLDKFGTGNLTLTATEAYDGPTIITAGTLQIGATGTAGAGGPTGLLPAGGNIIDSGTLLYSKTTTDTISGVISGSGAVTKLSTGQLILSNTNTYTGQTTISSITATPSAGSVLVTANNALGTGPVQVAYNTGGTSAQLQLSGNITLNNTIFSTTGAGSDLATGGVSGVIRNISGNNTITSQINQTGGGGFSTYRSDAGTLTFTGTVGSTATASRDMTLVGAGNFAFTGLIRDSNQANASDKIQVVSSNTGVTTFSGTANTYTGTTTVNNGSTLNVALLAGVNTPSSIGQGSAAGSAADLVLDNGTLQYTGPTAQALTRPFTIGTNGGKFDASGSAPGATVLVSSAATLAGTNTARTLTLTGTNTGANTYSSVIADNGTGATTLAKSGTGRWLLPTANTYTGGTNITAGLLLANAAVTPTGTTGATVVTTGGALGGTGTIGAPVTLTGTGTITAGSSTTDPSLAGVLSTASGNLTSWNPGGTYVWKVLTQAGAPATGGADQLNLAGDLSFGSGALAATNQFNLAIKGAANLPAGTPGASPSQQANSVYQIIKLPSLTSVLSNFTPTPIMLANGSTYSDVSAYFNITADSGFLSTAAGNFHVVLDDGTLVHNDLTTGTSGLDLVFTPTPEPVVTSILGLAALALTRRPRRRRDA